MSLPAQRLADGLRRIARASGAFAMVAMDQRESLRTMFAERMGEPVRLERRVAFKLAVARLLSPHASGLLIDRPEGLEPLLEANVLDPACGLIVAADRLVQPEGEPVQDTQLDEELDISSLPARGVAALKLLVLWGPDRDARARAELVGRFLEESRSAGLPGIVEAVVRPPSGVEESSWTDADEAILEAAREFGMYAPDLYKAQVPFHGTGDPQRITEQCRRISRLVPCPWVVLSSGVAIDDFPRAVEAACRGGASGFLAGRAVWRDAIGPEPEIALRERSVPRLRRLGSVVDAEARPWEEAFA